MTLHVLFGQAEEFDAAILMTANSEDFPATCRRYFIVDLPSDQTFDLG